MLQVPKNTCICNVTRSNIQPSGVWIDNVEWDSSNEAFTCSGRDTKYIIKCSQNSLMEAGLNTNMTLLLLFSSFLFMLSTLIFYKWKKSRKDEEMESKI